MLWIMASPEGGIQTADKQRNIINMRTEEAIHGEDQGAFKQQTNSEI
jgi:hypothetical protein